MSGWHRQTRRVRRAGLGGVHPHGRRDGRHSRGPREPHQQLQVLPGETLGSILDGSGRVAAATEALVTVLPSLDVSHPLPEAPWFPPGTRWSARSVLLHILAETAQHAGHADIIREALDGAKTMG